VPVDHFSAIADRYDALEAARFDPAHLGPQVDLLAELAGAGPALELAIGTGRVAVPLAARGVDVHGIDLSPGMVAELRAKPGGDAIPVTLAAHLAPGGCFVIEVGVPPLRRLPPGSTALVSTDEPGHLGIDEIDLVHQHLTSHHHHSRADRCEVHSTPQRYVWPSELDLMARIAGLRLRHRWADWRRSPFTGESDHHVSVWEREV
jgi:SAM-dependent methyltransferase